MQPHIFRASYLLPVPALLVFINTSLTPCLQLLAGQGRREQTAPNSPISRCVWLPKDAADACAVRHTSIPPRHPLRPKASVSIHSDIQ